MEIRYEMDGVAWREARKALLLRRVVVGVTILSGFCLAMIGTMDTAARIVVLIAWPIGVALVIFFWRRTRHNSVSNPQGTYTIRATPEQLEVEYSVGHAWFSWDFVDWTKRSGFLVGWVRGSGVVCLPAGAYTPEQEAELRALKANSAGHHPSPPPQPGYDELEVAVDNSRALRVRGAQVYMDALREKNRKGIRILSVIAGLIGLMALLLGCTGEPLVLALAVFDAGGFFALASAPFWGPHLHWLRKPVGERFTLHAGPKGVWVHSVRGTSAIQWKRVTQILHGRATTAICVGAQVTPIPDLSFERTLDGEEFADRARAWQEAASALTEIPNPDGVVSPDIANPFAPPA